MFCDYFPENSSEIIVSWKEARLGFAEIQTLHQLMLCLPRNTAFKYTYLSKD
jgi:hypothetical protein